MNYLPLYRMEKPSQYRGNSGLLLQKFSAYWTSKFDKFDKTRWLEHTCSSRVGDQQQLTAYNERIKQLTQIRAGQQFIVGNISRFIPGMGNSHPLENGMTWHHTLGVPYLPGSSVKGITHAWAKTWANATEKDINAIFGFENHVGEIIFLDALPLAPVKLEPDIMALHYGNYYANPDQPPRDWDDPIPIPFLTIAKGQRFVFTLLPRKKTCDPDHLVIAKEWLKQALSIIGAGAKTAVGYGIFQPEQS
jgi:CRISPR-associated protein Cmr6